MTNFEKIVQKRLVAAGRQRVKEAVAYAKRINSPDFQLWGRLGAWSMGGVVQGYNCSADLSDHLVLYVEKTENESEWRWEVVRERSRKERIGNGKAATVEEAKTAAETVAANFLEPTIRAEEARKKARRALEKKQRQAESTVD